MRKKEQYIMPNVSFNHNQLLSHTFISYYIVYILPPLFLQQVLNVAQATLSYITATLLCNQRSSWTDPPASTSGALGLHTCIIMSGFMQCWVSNPGHCTCWTSMLPSELHWESLCPYFKYSLLALSWVCFEALITLSVSSTKSNSSVLRMYKTLWKRAARKIVHEYLHQKLKIQGITKRWPENEC